MSPENLRALGGIALSLLIALAVFTFARAAVVGCKPVTMVMVDTYGFFWLDECGRMHHTDLDGNERWVN